MASRKNVGDAAASFFTEATEAVAGQEEATGATGKRKSPRMSVEEETGRPTRNINALIFADDHETLRKVAWMKHTSVNGLIREIISDYCKSKQQIANLYDKQTEEMEGV